MFDLGRHSTCGQDLRAAPELTAMPSAVPTPIFPISPQRDRSAHNDSASSYFAPSKPPRLGPVASCRDASFRRPSPRTPLRSRKGHYASTMRKATRVWALTVALALSGCGTSGATPTGTVTGQLLRVGGPAPGSPVAIPGSVTLQEVSTGRRFRASTATDGRFSVKVPAGTYEVSGQSPQVLSNNREIVGTAGSVVRVQANETSRANVHISIR